MDETVTVATGNNSVSQSMAHTMEMQSPSLSLVVISKIMADTSSAKAKLPVIYLSILRKFGIQRDQFGNSKQIVQL